jgi:hypothetical protein
MKLMSFSFAVVPLAGAFMLLQPTVAHANAASCLAEYKKCISVDPNNPSVERGCWGVYEECIAHPRAGMEPLAVKENPSAPSSAR